MKLDLYIVVPDSWFGNSEIIRPLNHAIEALSREHQDPYKDVALDFVVGSQTEYESNTGRSVCLIDIGVNVSVHPDDIRYFIVMPYTTNRNESDLLRYFKDELSTGLTYLMNTKKNSDNLVLDDDNVISTLEAFLRDEPDSLLTAHQGQIDLARTSARIQEVATRIEAAGMAVDALIYACEQGNQQHAALGAFGKQYRAALEALKGSESSLLWYLAAQQIESYRSNYVAVSRVNPGEFPPLEPALSTVIDTVVLATGILARMLPEIAKSQDDFERYAGRQVATRHEVRRLVDATLSDLATSQGVLTNRAHVVAQAVAELDYPSAADLGPEATRIASIKAGFVRSFLGALARRAVEAAHLQFVHLREATQTRALYDITKEIVKRLLADGFSKFLKLLHSMKDDLISLAHCWPSMFGFIRSLLHLLGIL